MSKDIFLGTCSWNYDSWVGLVYSSPKRTAAEYLREYATKFDTVEVDSWYYKIPTQIEAGQYRDATPDGFLFTCKVVQDITVPFKRNFSQDRSRSSAVKGSSEKGALFPPGFSDDSVSLEGSKGSHPRTTLEPNPTFLSAEVFRRYCEGIEPLQHKIALLIFEFEYLNREKMESLEKFLKLMEDFLAKIHRSYRIGIETRNKNYLTREYFAFLRDQGVEHVFSEKQYMPPVYEVYERFKEYLGEWVVVRLLGGDRAQMEAKTGERWDRIVEPRPDKDRIVRMSLDARYSGRRVILNVNNHYEGSAPLTIMELSRLFERIRY
ncbi:MAG: DUF72 domain-containing protein [Spirochaetes bacterium]|nr:DUF72 domain-containing protein [Spirochaetota bacterium]